MTRLKHMLSSGAIAAILAASALAGSAASAGAERLRDYIYSDSYGNLVIYSRAGYKRIVVGKGYLADELSEYSGTTSDEPHVVRADEAQTYRDCYRPPVVVYGRSFMYGLRDGEMPEISPCAD